MLSATKKTLSALERLGLLLKQDKKLPNVVTLVTGEVLSTSWWSHPRGRLIFSVLSELSEHPDVLFTKLLLGKDTLVHRAYWPDLLAVATANEPWQRLNLSPEARGLFEKARTVGGSARSSGPAVKELTSSLLVHNVEVHTESGQHETAIELWPAWAARAGVVPTSSVVDARKALERACEGMGAPIQALPWVSRKNSPR